MSGARKEISPRGERFESTQDRLERRSKPDGGGIDNGGGSDPLERGGSSNVGRLDDGADSRADRT